MNMIRTIWLTLCLAVSQGNSLPHGYFEEERLKALEENRLERRGNVDVDTMEGHAYCHLTSYLAFSRAADTECNLKQAAKIYRELAAMMMAMKHFNQGDGVVIPEIHEINQRCPIKLSAEFVDSKYTPAIPVQSLTKIMESRDPTVFTQDPVPCAVVGARTSSATGPVAVVSGVFDLPHMSYTATSPELNDPFRYPLFSRVVTSDDAAAKAGLRFMTEVQESSHIAVMYINDPFGIEYNKALLNEALRLGLTVRSFPLNFPPDPENIQQVIKSVKETGYRHVYLIIFSSFIESVMLEAQRQGITGPDYSFLLGISTSFFEDAEYTPEQANAFEGMAVLPEFGAKPRTDGYERFIQIWNQQTADDVAYFNTKLPLIAGKNGTECFQAESDFFTKTNYNVTGDTAPFAYDTVIAMGLGACNAYQERQEQKLDGESHALSIVASEFVGATGFIQMDAQTRARDPLSFSYAILNVQGQTDSETGMVTFTTPESYLIQPNDERTDWLIEQTGSFFYNDGSEQAPPSLPEIDIDYNWIGGWHILGYVLSGVILWISVALAGWSWLHREARAVRLSQPPFLIMICLGTFILGSMLIPLGMDDENFDERATDIACMSQPWLASIGFVTVFSALYSKTSRINQIMKNAIQFKTVKVSEKDVLVPFFILLSANVAVLLCWTIIDPLSYVRTFDEGTDTFNRPVSSTGRCVSDGQHGAAPYLACLAAVNLGAVILANIQAYKARNLSDDLSEAKYIGLIMVCLLQTWLTGGPILFLVYDNPVSHYVVVSMINFLTCMAVLSLIFVPKILLFKEWKAGTINEQVSQGGQRFGDSVLRGSGVSGLRHSGIRSMLPSIEEKNASEEISTELHQDRDARLGAPQESPRADTLSRQSSAERRTNSDDSV